MRKPGLLPDSFKNGTNLDFASLTAYYDFKREWIQKIGLERLKLSFYMNDICKFSSIKVERGLDYPFARTMSFALSATF